MRRSIRYGDVVALVVAHSHGQARAGSGEGYD